MKNRILFWIVLGSVIASVRLFAADSTFINTTDLLKVQQLQSVAISADGTTVAYTVRSIESDTESDAEKKGDPEKLPLEKYRYDTQIFLASIDGNRLPRQITQDRAGASQPAWDPSGKRIAFVRKVKEKSQIFILSLEGGEPWQLTKAEEGASDPIWSPDGNHILYDSGIPHHEIRKQLEKSDSSKAEPAWPVEVPGRTPGDVANWADKDAKKPKADPDGNLQQIREWLARNASQSNPRVFDRLDLQGEADLEMELGYNHWFVIPVQRDAKELEITPGYYSFGGADWISNQSIVLSGSMDSKIHPDRDVDSDLFTVSSDGTDLNQLLDLKNFAVFAPVVSPDHKTIAFQYTDENDQGYSMTRMGVISVAGGQPQLITANFDRDADNAVWSQDSKWIYFATASNGGFPLYRISARGGEPVRLTGFDSGIGAFDVSAKNIVYVFTNPSNPYELYSALPDGKGSKKLTSHNSTWIASRTLSAPDPRHLTRPDGTVIDYWIMKPASFQEGEKYPLLVEMHGGPSAMWGPGEDTTWFEFQFFAAKGYGVVFSNQRGSGGYGYKFKKQNYQDWGEDPGEDVLAVATETVKEPWVDADRQVLTGGSYAGYLTAWIVGHDNRFKAAIAQRGVYDLPTFMGEGNAWRLVPDHFGGYPWEEQARSVLLRESPLTYVQQIQTPLMIKHGDNDRRTGFVQSETLYKSLKIQGKPVEYVRYPGATHELSRSGDPLQRMDRLLRFFEFMERFIGPTQSAQ